MKIKMLLLCLNVNYVFFLLISFPRCLAFGGPLSVRAARLLEGAGRHLRGQVKTGHSTLQGRACTRHSLPGICEFVLKI
jgi:hypothetical protein